MKGSVWSFGVTLWEILTLCRQKPLAHIPDHQLLTLAEKYGTSATSQVGILCGRQWLTLIDTNSFLVASMAPSTSSEPTWNFWFDARVLAERSCCSTDFSTHVSFPGAKGGKLHLLPCRLTFRVCHFLCQFYLNPSVLCRHSNSILIKVCLHLSFWRQLYPCDTQTLIYLYKNLYLSFNFPLKSLTPYKNFDLHIKLSSTDTNPGLLTFSYR